MGDYLILGLHDDETVSYYKGKRFPILNDNERMLNMLANKYVDEVILGAPWKVSEHMIRLLNISVVAESNKQKSLSITMEDPYQIPKQKNIYQ